jgi:hypothetical protein
VSEKSLTCRLAASRRASGVAIQLTERFSLGRSERQVGLLHGGELRIAMREGEREGQVVAEVPPPSHGSLRACNRYVVSGMGVAGAEELEGGAVGGGVKKGEGWSGLNILWRTTCVTLSCFH